MKAVQLYFILSSASLTHSFWLITDYFAQIWAGGLRTNHVHPAVCPHGLSWVQGTVAGLGEPVWAGLVAAHWQSCTFNILWAPTSPQPRWDTTLRLPPCPECDFGPPLGPALNRHSPWEKFCSSQNLPTAPSSSFMWGMKDVTIYYTAWDN